MNGNAIKIHKLNHIAVLREHPKNTTQILYIMLQYMNRFRQGTIAAGSGSAVQRAIFLCFPTKALHVHLRRSSNIFQRPTCSKESYATYTYMQYVTHTQKNNKLTHAHYLILTFYHTLSCSSFRSCLSHPHLNGIIMKPRNCTHYLITLLQDSGTNRTTLFKLLHLHSETPQGSNK